MGKVIFYIILSLACLVAAGFGGDWQFTFASAYGASVMAACYEFREWRRS